MGEIDKCKRCIYRKKLERFERENAAVLSRPDYWRRHIGTDDPKELERRKKRRPAKCVHPYWESCIGCTYNTEKETVRNAPDWGSCFMNDNF